MRMKQVVLIAVWLGLVAGYSAAEVLTVTASADAHLAGKGVYADTNYGNGPQMLVGNHPSLGNFHGLLRFDLSKLESGVEITSVTLKLSKPAVGVGGPFVCRVYQLSPENGDWVEGDGARGSKTSCWNGKGSAAWAGSAGASMAGTDYFDVQLAEYKGDVQPGVALFVSKEEFKAAVKQNAGGVLNLGVGLNSGAESKFYRFSTKEGGDPAQLIIEYTKILG